MPTIPDAFRSLTADGVLLFATRTARMFAYGFLSVVLAIYLKAIGLSDEDVGLLLTMTLLGDVVLSLWLTTSADRIGRKYVLVVGAILMALVGGVFASTMSFSLLLAAATVGVLSPSDKEVGPFLAIEQAALSQTVPNAERTNVFAWYNLVGSLAAALGTLAGGAIAQLFEWKGFEGAAIYRPLAIAYGVVGVGLVLAFLRLSPAAESPPAVQPTRLGLHRSLGVVLRLSGLFALDAFAGGFVIQSTLAYWFYWRFEFDLAELGALFFAANLLAAGSALAAASLAKRFGLINTMVFTHLPSNVLLILVPLMPNATLAATMLLLRFAISQMDVPTRQSYVMAVVHPDERSSASGVTTVARSIGAAIAPWLAWRCFQLGLVDVPLYVAGGVKIVYDLLLYRAFVSHRPDGEGTSKSSCQAP